MGWKTENRVKGIPPGWVTPAERLVLMVMAGYVDDDSLPRCFASKVNIALACGWTTTKSLNRHWKELTDGGWLLPVKGQSRQQGKFTPEEWLLAVPDDWDSEVSVEPTGPARRLAERSRRGKQFDENRLATVSRRSVRTQRPPAVEPRWRPPSSHSVPTKEKERNRERAFAARSEHTTGGTAAVFHPDDCPHRAMDEDGYCTACKGQVAS